MTSFVDRAVLHVAAGHGGHGCASVHREKFKPLGGPDGGNGGKGGDVVLVVDSGAHTLLDFQRRPHQRAGNGRQGEGSNRNGAAGADLELRVPEGTVVLTTAGEVLADLVGDGTRFVVAEGGHGGLGNAALASSKRKAPGFALFGEPGDELEVVLELKSVADVGLIGFPSAGKSSLVAALSAARPKIADYPFTTLVPNLGVVTAGEVSYTVADVPGLIPGAAAGKGLGLEFLRHIERCAVLVHVIDCASEEPGRDPVADIQAIEHELAEYTADLADRPRLVALNKVDVPAARELAEMVRPDVEALGWPVYEISVATRAGLAELSYAMAERVTEFRNAAPPGEPTRIVLRPRAIGQADFTVARDGEEFVVSGQRPERWIRQTDFSNDEAVGYLADRLARLGVEDALAEAGAQAGDAVRIGEVTFDWQPTTAEYVPSRRGTDVRLETNDRVRAVERREAKRARRRPYEEREESE